MSRQRSERRTITTALAEGFFDLSADPMCVIGPKSFLVRVNAAMREATGYSEEELLNTPYLEFIHPEDLEPTAQEIEKFKSGHLIRDFENRIRCKNKSYKWFSWSCYPIREGKLAHATARDVTDLKQAEMILRESEEKYYNLVERANDGILIVQDGRVEFVNRKVPEMLGLPVEAVLHRPITDYTSPAFVREFISHEEDGSTGTAWPRVRETVLRRRDGSELYVEVSAGPATYMGRPASLVFLRDMTERKRAEESLRESEERYRRLVETISEGLDCTDRDYTFTYVNQGFCNMLGYSREEMIGHALLEFVHENCKELMENEIARRRRGQADKFELAWRAKDGRVVYTLASPTVVFDEKGNFTGSTAVLTDITARKHTEECQALIARLLGELNRPGSWEETLRTVLRLIRDFVKIGAVGVRLRREHDFPYFVTEGFPGNFIKAENFLCARGPDGGIILDETGRPYLECMCGNVLSGRTDPSKPFFTENGSFWTNSTTDLLAGTTSKDRLTRIRNRCNTAGYESVALIPIRAGQEIVGLLQLNDKKRNFFTLDGIHFFEQIGTSLGMAIGRHQAEEALRESEARAKALMNATTDSAILLDSEARIIAINESGAQRLGRPRQELMGTCIFDVMPPNVAERRKAHMKRVIRTRRFARFRDERDGMIFDNSCFPICDAQGKVVQFAVFSRDITEQVRADEEIRNLANFPSENPHPILRISGDGTILYGNPASRPLLQFWGTQPGQKLPEEWQKTVVDTLNSNRNHMVEVQQDGRTFSLTLTPVPERGYVNIYAMDISQRKLAEEELKKLNETLELQVAKRSRLVKLLQDIAVIANESGTVEDAFRTGLSRICQHMKWPLGHAWMVKDNGSGALANTDIWYAEPAHDFSRFIKATARKTYHPGTGWAARAAAKAKPQWTADIGNEPCRHCREAGHMGMKSALALPVMVGDCVVGILEFLSAKTVEPDEQIMRVAAYIGTQLGRVVERRQFQQQMIDAVWQEQCRFGQELHDGICQQVASIGMLAETLLAKLHGKSEPEAKVAASILEVAQSAKEHASTLARALHPVHVDAEALSYALEELASNTEALYGIPCTFKRSKLASLEDNNCANHLFRIAQEALMNAIKHSRAKKTELSLSGDRKYLTLEVRDDGIGIEKPKRSRPGGVGLGIMQYRAQAIGATLDIHSARDGGTVVSCRLKHRKQGK